mgnify:CR=1 FL=1
MFYGTHGFLPEENRLGQRFVVDLTLEANLKEAAIKDCLDLSINYAEVYEVVKLEVEQTEVKLIETLAENIAQRVLKQFPVSQVSVKVKKVNPPIKDFHGSVSVEIVRRRKA